VPRGIAVANREYRTRRVFDRVDADVFQFGPVS
jgi:hypothetical protein